MSAPAATTPAGTAVRAGIPEVAACVLAVAVLLDGWLTHLVAPVFWGAILIVAAMALAAVRRVRAGQVPTTSPVTRHHAPLGLLVLALLQIAMIPATDAAPASAPGEHSHGGFAAVEALGLIAPLASLGLAALTVLAVMEPISLRTRTTVVVMAIAVLLAAGSVISG